jgi:hypothetical protein
MMCSHACSQLGFFSLILILSASRLSRLLICSAAGATGGFAGGEKGLKQFIETGDVQLRDPRQPGPKQFSPVTIAGLLVVAGAGGGLLLNELTDLGEIAVRTEITNVSAFEDLGAGFVACVQSE